MQGFSVFGGSVPGTDHTKPGQPVWKNNQDALDFIESDFIVAAVCDGCGSADYSEVGARLGARLAVNSVAAYLREGNAVAARGGSALMERVLEDLLRGINDVAHVLSGGDRLLFRSMVGRYFLFTTLVVAMDAESTVVLSFGDGVYAINDEVYVIGQSDGNKPPYPAYLITGTTLDPDALDFRLRALLPTREVKSVLIGTDGVADLLKLEQTEIPWIRKPERVGPLSQFWTDSLFVKNPDGVRRRLATINKEWVSGLDPDNPFIKGGFLPDDTTLVVVRRT